MRNSSYYIHCCFFIYYYIIFAIPIFTQDKLFVLWQQNNLSSFAIETIVKEEDPLFTQTYFNHQDSQGKTLFDSIVQSNKNLDANNIKILNALLGTTLNNNKNAAIDTSLIQQKTIDILSTHKAFFIDAIKNNCCNLALYLAQHNVLPDENSSVYDKYSDEQLPLIIWMIEQKKCLKEHVFKILLQKVPDLFKQIKKSDNSTLFHALANVNIKNASKDEVNKIINFLLDQSNTSDINKKNTFNKTSLDIALKENNIPFIAACLEHVQTPLETIDSKEMPLIYRAIKINANLEVFYLLLHKYPQSYFNTSHSIVYKNDDGDDVHFNGSPLDFYNYIQTSGYTQINENIRKMINEKATNNKVIFPFQMTDEQQPNFQYIYLLTPQTIVYALEDNFIDPIKTIYADTMGAYSLLDRLITYRNLTVSIIKKLKSKNFDFNTRVISNGNNSIIRWALIHDIPIDIIKELIDRQYKGAAQVTEPLLLSAIDISDSRKTHAEVDALGNLLLKYGASLDLKDEAGNTVLHKALTWRTLNFAIDNNANSNARNNKGQTPLHTQTNLNQFVLRKMINNGGDINSQDLEGKTPLMTNLNPKLFLKEGANPFIVDKYGRNALFYNTESIAAFADYGLPFDIVDHDGETPLTYAAKKASRDHKQKPFFYALINAGANPLIKNKNGETAFTILHSSKTLFEYNILQNTESEFKQLAQLNQQSSETILKTFLTSLNTANTLIAEKITTLPLFSDIIQKYDTEILQAITARQEIIKNEVSHKAIFEQSILQKIEKNITQQKKISAALMNKSYNQELQALINQACEEKDYALFQLLLNRGVDHTLLPKQLDPISNTLLDIYTIQNNNDAASLRKALENPAIKNIVFDNQSIENFIKTTKDIELHELQRNCALLSLIIIYS